MQQNEYKAEILNSEKDTISNARNTINNSYNKINDENICIEIYEKKETESNINDECGVNTSEIKLVINESSKKNFFKDQSIDLNEVQNESPIKIEKSILNDDGDEFIMQDKRNSLLFSLKGLNLYSYFNMESKSSRKYWNTNVRFFLI